MSELAATPLRAIGPEHCPMPLPIAVALFAAWLAGSELLREALVSEVLLERASDPASGTPRWRAALGLYFQASMLL